MKHRLLVGSALIATVAATAFLTPAAAQAATSPTRPIPTITPTHGAVTFSAVTPMTTKNVSGGTWTYGSSLDGTQKHCYSYFVHPTHQHTSTAIIGSHIVKATAKPGNWSRADTYGSLFSTCYAYYDVI